MSTAADEPDLPRCWPAADERLLLRAAVREGEEALASWREWNAGNTLDTLDADSLPVLPEIYTNLRLVAPDAPGMARLRGTHRYTWSRNQQLIRDIAPLLDSLTEADIEVMALDDLALVASYFGDYGRRPIAGLHVLVRPSHVRQAIEVIQSLGWRAGVKSIERLMQGRSALSIWRPGGPHAMLHWRAFDGRPTAEDEREVWPASVPLTLGSVTIARLSPADQLVRLCGYQICSPAAPPSRWIIDSVTLLRSSSATMNWDRVARTSMSAHVTRPVLHALTYLKDELDMDVPAATLQRLHAAPPSALEQADYSLRVKGATAARRFALHWHRHTTLNHTASRLQATATFPRYLQQIWDLDHVWQVPMYAGLHRQSPP